MRSIEVFLHVFIYIGTSWRIACKRQWKWLNASSCFCLVTASTSTTSPDPARTRFNFRSELTHYHSTETRSQVECVGRDDVNDESLQLSSDGCISRCPVDFLQVTVITTLQHMLNILYALHLKRIIEGVTYQHHDNENCHILTQHHHTVLETLYSH